MTNFKPFQINADKVWRMWPLISNEETRYYLCGICVERHPDGAILSATDGHVLGTWLDRDSDLPSDHPTAGVIIRLSKEAVATCKRVAKAVERAGGGAVVEIKPDGSATVTETNSDGETLSSASYTDCVIDGTFPDWRRVLPDLSSDKQDLGTHFNSAYVKRFQLGDTRAPISFRIADQHSPIGVRVGGEPDFYGALMPMRGFETDKPEWLSTPASVTEKEDAQ